MCKHVMTCIQSSHLIVLAAIVLAASPVQGQAPGWTQVWHDEFDGAALDASKWTPESTTNPANNERQAYLPQQVTVADGNMIITSENVPFGGKQYRSGRVHSNYVQRHGRWEVRADLPTSRGMWPAIWLLPNTSQYRWPSQGEIDILENRGNEPTLTSSAYHFGTNPPFSHSFRTANQTTARFGVPENYHTGFHTYAVEWDASKVRFFVDDVHHWTVFNSDTGGRLGSQTAPMQTMLNTAVGGDFLGNQQPDATTVWPQQFLIDYVRIFERNSDAIPFRNGGFEANDGSLASWSVFGNRAGVNNVSVHREAIADGAASLKLFGQSTGSANLAGASQGVTVAPGDEVIALAQSFIRSQDSLAGSANSVVMKVEFYNDFGGRHGTAAFLDEVTQTIADGASPNDQWRAHELMAVAPAGAVEARLAFVFTQPGAAGGAIHIDNVSFANTRLNPAADADNDGDVDADDLEVWRQQHGLQGDQPADANGDGTVDGQDFLQWQRELGNGGSEPLGGASNQSVPEPWGPAMALTALARLLKRPAVPFEE